MASQNLPEMPCGPILELHGQRKRFHVPFGLKQLLERMSREVLRDQPENVIEYLACFMEARVMKKAEEKATGTRRKSWEVHRWSFEASSVLSAHALEEFLKTLKPSSDEATRCAIMIQKVYRGHHDRVIVKELRKSRESAHLPEIGKHATTQGETEADSVTNEDHEHTAPEPDEIKYLPDESDDDENLNQDQDESDINSQTYELEENGAQDYGTEVEEEEDSLHESHPPSDHHDEEEERKDEFIMLKAPSSIGKVESKMEGHSRTSTTAGVTGDKPE